MSYTRRVAYNTIIQVIGKAITTVISLFLIAALTRYLGVTGFGYYTTIFAYSQFFAVIADFGFFWYLVREISKINAQESKIFNNVLTFRSIVAAIIFSLSVVIALFIPQYQEIRMGILIVAFGSFWMALNGTYIGLFQKNLRMDKAALTDVLGRIIILAIVLYLIGKEGSLNQILWAYFIGNLVNFIATAWLGRVYLHFRLAFDWSYWKEIFWQCLPISIVTILGMVYFKIDTVLLSLLKSPEDVGIYGPPYKILEILLLFPTIFMGNVFPIFSRYLSLNDPKIKVAFQKSFDFLCLFAFPIVVGVILTAKRIISLVAGPEFLTATTIAPLWGRPATTSLVLQILIVAVGISFLSHLFSYMVIALGRQTKLIGPNIFLVLFNLVLNFILIPKYSYLGAALVTVLTESLVVILYWKVMRCYIDLKINFSILWKVIFSGMIMGLLLRYFFFLSLWFLVPLGVIVYFVFLYLVKGISKEMITALIRANPKS